MVDPKKLVAIYEEALGKKSPMDALEYALLCVYDFGYSEAAFRGYVDNGQKLASVIKQVQKE